MIETLESPSLLIAMPQLHDSNFAKAVVLVVEHTEKGALGFVINRPAARPLRELLQIPNAEIPLNFPAWFGGPVGGHSGLVLHDQPGDDTHSLRLGMALSSSELSLKGMLSFSQAYSELYPPERTVFSYGRVPGYKSLYPYRFLVGYAGWGPKQLDEELRQGCWLQVAAQAELVFNTPWNQMWQSAIHSMGVNPMEIALEQQSYLN